MFASLPAVHPNVQPLLPASAAGQGLVTYEQLLDQDTEWALTEGSLFFEGRGAVQETLKRITARLEQLGIPYAVAGGMALYLHGYRRFTEDVDILVTKRGLEQIHQALDGLGYRRPFEGSKHLRDTDSKVKIEFLTTGSYPGDGKPKSIAFPDPNDAAEVINGVRVLGLISLIDLKLASGMTGSDRAKDLIDVGELVRYLRLPKSLTDQLHEFGREKYLEIWQQINPSDKRYLLQWRIQQPTSRIPSIDEFIASLDTVPDELWAMQAAGVTIDARSKPSQGCLYLMTHDPAIADQFHMHDESEFWDLDAPPALSADG